MQMDLICANGSTRRSPTNGFISKTINHFGGDMLWHPTKPEIQDWVDFKALEFARGESEGSRLIPTQWLNRYLYIYIHEILFCEFPVYLYEWLLRLATQRRNFQGGEPIDWSPQLIERMKSVNNSICRAVDLWVNNILGGHIT